MSHRLFFTYNRPANVENHYVVGSGVGSKSRFVRSALRRRSNNNAQGKPCCFPMSNSIQSNSIQSNSIQSNSIQSNSIHSTPPLDSIEELPTYGDENNLWCDQSFSPYSVGDTSMCCWTDDYNASPQGCKDINSVCYTGPNEGLIKTCPNNNIIKCSSVLWGCGKNNECRPDLSGTYPTYNLCISGCSTPPPPPPPSGLPDVKKVIYFSSGQPTSTTPAPRDWNLLTNAVTQSIDAGFNIFILSFIITGTGDYPIKNTKLYTKGNLINSWWKKWAEIPKGTALVDASNVEDISKVNFINNVVHPAGALLFVSAAGGMDYPWNAYPGHDGATQYGVDVAQFVINNHLDGIDFDLEHFGSGIQVAGMSPADTITWIENATRGAYEIFQTQSKQYYISHAPQAPYFGPIDYQLHTTCPAGGECWPGSSCQSKTSAGEGANCSTTPTSCWCTPSFVFDVNLYSTGGYSKIYQDCSNMIDFFNVQFYNQGGSAYNTFASLVVKSQPPQYGTSYQQIHSYGIPYDKIVIGKPLLSTDTGDGGTGSGYVDATVLNSIYRDITTKKLTPNIHTMAWQYHDNNPVFANWINTVYQGL